MKKACRNSKWNCFVLKLLLRSIILLFVFQITRRYAEFSAAIVSLNESFPDDKVQPNFMA